MIPLSFACQGQSEAPESGSSPEMPTVIQFIRMATAIWGWQEKWRELRFGLGLCPTDYRWGPLVEDEEGHEEAVLSQGLGLLPSLSTLFCWVIGGVLPGCIAQRSPEIVSRGLFKLP